MNDRSQLIKALRCKKDDCEGCDLAFFDHDEGWMCTFPAKSDEAADAIIELQEEIKELLAKRHIELNKAWKEGYDSANIRSDSSWQNGE